MAACLCEGFMLRPRLSWVTLSHSGDSDTRINVAFKGGFLSFSLITESSVCVCVYMCFWYGIRGIQNEASLKA